MQLCEYIDDSGTALCSLPRGHKGLHNTDSFDAVEDMYALLDVEDCECWPDDEEHPDEQTQWEEAHAPGIIGYCGL